MTLVPLELASEDGLLPTPQEIHQAFPLTKGAASFIQRSREALSAILKGSDPRLLVIVGPCSIHDPLSALEYGQKLAELSEKISDRFFLVMRSYFEKSRTVSGWKGMLYDPDLDGSYQLSKGIHQTRKLLLELTEMGIPVGSELLEINTIPYYSDFLTWGCIGARTCSSPPHRQIASQLNFPVGFKNSTDGNVDLAIQGILAASSPQAYLGISTTGLISKIQTEGNPLGHVVLRGGKEGPNYGPDQIEAVLKKCRQAEINPHLIVDCSHDNCGKKPEQQKAVLASCLHHRAQGKTSIVGVMLESHLNEGSQEITPSLKYGVSITDPCLGWEETKKCLLEAY